MPLNPIFTEIVESKRPRILDRNLISDDLHPDATYTKLLMVIPYSCRIKDSGQVLIVNEGSEIFETIKDGLDRGDDSWIKWLLPMPEDFKHD